MEKEFRIRISKDKVYNGVEVNVSLSEDELRGAIKVLRAFAENENLFVAIANVTDYTVGKMLFDNWKQFRNHTQQDDAKYRAIQSGLCEDIRNACWQGATVEDVVLMLLTTDKVGRIDSIEHIHFLDDISNERVQRDEVDFYTLAMSVEYHLGNSCNPDEAVVHFERSNGV